MKRNIHVYDVGVVLDVPLPPSFDAQTMSLEATLRKPEGSTLLVPVTNPAGVVRYTAAKGDLNVRGEYALTVTVKSKTTDDERVLEPLFFRVWPRGRQGTS